MELEPNNEYDMTPEKAQELHNKGYVFRIATGFKREPKQKIRRYFLIGVKK